jgi:hypothetical protein
MIVAVEIHLIILKQVNKILINFMIRMQILKPKLGQTKQQYKNMDQNI